MIEQFERAQRYLNRLRRVYQGVPAAWDTRHEFGDDVYSFFVHCYHIRDWIIALNRVGVSAQDVDRYINDHDCLRLCADLCNASKHCHLTRTTRSQADPQLAMTTHEGGLALVGGKHVEMLSSTFTVAAGERLVDALVLAEDCMTAWTAYIQELRERAISAGLLPVQSGSVDA